MEILAVIGAIVLAVLGYILGSKSGSTDTEAIDEYVEDTGKAATDYADAMADTPDGRVNRVLEWFRKRTGDR